MKKLFTFLVLGILLSGCATNSNESFLDEKIKCKKMAEERFDELSTRHNTESFKKHSAYSSALDTCLINYSYSWSNADDTYIVTSKIKDAISKNIISEISSNKNYSEDSKKFDKKLKLYFGKDAE